MKLPSNDHDPGPTPTPASTYAEGERTVPSVNRPQTGGGKLLQSVLITVAALVGFGMLYLYLPHHRSNSTPVNGSGVVVKNDKGRIDSDIPALDIAKLMQQHDSKKPVVIEQVRTEQLPPPIIPAADQAQIDRDKKAADDLIERRQRSPLLAFGGQSEREGSATAPSRAGTATGAMTADQAAVTIAAIGSQMHPVQPAPQKELESRLTPTKLSAVSATTLGDRDLLLTEGAFLDCTLETALDTTVPGFTKCLLTRDIYSDSGRVVLLERGTQLIGQYSGGIKQGEARIFALWTRAETPHGVIINLGSPGTDGLGAAGMRGFVDTHFWARFGGALLVSVVNDAFTVLASSQGAGVQSTSNTQGAVKDSASIALENSINIPPTLYKNQGDQINVIVARDLDFSGVYGLRLTHASGG